MKTFTDEEIRDFYKDIFADFKTDEKLKKALDKVDEIRFDMEQAVADVAYAAEMKGFVEGFRLRAKMAEAAGEV